VRDIPKDHWPVHESHCCPIHGCKYGDENCPVVLKLTEKYSDHCEMCDWDYEDPDCINLLQAFIKSKKQDDIITWGLMSALIDEFKNDMITVREQGIQDGWWKR